MCWGKLRASEDISVVFIINVTMHRVKSIWTPSCLCITWRSSSYRQANWIIIRTRSTRDCICVNLTLFRYIAQLFITMFLVAWKTHEVRIERWFDVKFFWSSMITCIRSIILKIRVFWSYWTSYSCSERVHWLMYIIFHYLTSSFVSFDKILALYINCCHLWLVDVAIGV